MILQYSTKDINYLIDLFIYNKSILLFNYQFRNKNWNNKFIKKFIKYLIFLGFVVSNNYQIKINIDVKKSQLFTNSVEITKKI